MTKPLPKLRLIDQRGDALIPPEELPFMGYYTRRGEKYFSGHWNVTVPNDNHDAELLGQEMALAFLRAAPDGVSTRQAFMAWLTMFVLGDQLRACAQDERQRDVVTAFWQTIVRFAEPVASQGNVDFWRDVCVKECEGRKRMAAKNRAIVKQHRSERAKAAAIKGWATRRRSAKRGKAVRS